jgi:hypothetical protein
LERVCSPLLTCFSLQLLRGKAAIQAIGIIPQLTGQQQPGRAGISLHENAP